MVRKGARTFTTTALQGGFRKLQEAKMPEEPKRGRKGSQKNKAAAVDSEESIEDSKPQIEIENSDDSQFLDHLSDGLSDDEGFAQLNHRMGHGFKDSVFTMVDHEKDF